MINMTSMHFIKLMQTGTKWLQVCLTFVFITIQFYSYFYDKQANVLMDHALHNFIRAPINDTAWSIMQCHILSLTWVIVWFTLMYRWILFILVTRMHFLYMAHFHPLIGSISPLFTSFFQRINICDKRWKSVNTHFAYNFLYNEVVVILCYEMARNGKRI